MKFPAQDLSPELRSLLVCPRCRGDLQDHIGGLACRVCRLVYPVVEGIPYLLEERGRKLRDQENG